MYVCTYVCMYVGNYMFFIYIYTYICMHMYVKYRCVCVYIYTHADFDPELRTPENAGVRPSTRGNMWRNFAALLFRPVFLTFQPSVDASSGGFSPTTRTDNPTTTTRAS